MTFTTERDAVQFYTGCLVGGAVGDALGAPVEFMAADEIFDRFGPSGIVSFETAFGRTGAITDDTQMALFTAEGLILSAVRQEGPEAAEKSAPLFVYQAYLRWLSTQDTVDPDTLIKQHGTCSIVDGVLTAHPELFARRSPGKTCLSALGSGRMGTVREPINRSKGCGGVMRIAPVGLFVEPEAAFRLGCEIAAITHGHPTGYLAAGALAQIISRIITGESLIRAISGTMARLAAAPDHWECLDAMRSAVRAAETSPAGPDVVERLGKGWVAEEALAIGIFAALKAGDDFTLGVRSAVNHGGDSDSTGAIAGSLLGALLGLDAIPPAWRHGVELAGLIEETGQDLFDRKIRRVKSSG